MILDPTEIPVLRSPAASLAFALVLLAVPAPTRAADPVPVIDLGFFDEEEGDLAVKVVAHAINEAGQVTGTNVMSELTNRAFLWEDNVLQNLGLAPGASNVTGRPPGPHSQGRAINATGVIAGGSCCYKQTAAANGPSANRAALWSAGTWTLLGTEEFTAPSTALGINDAGHVVGQHAPTIGALQFAFRWLGSGALETLPGLTGAQNSQARDINNLGQIVGVSSQNGTFTNHAALWLAGGTPLDLGTFGGAASEANAINDAGLIVGYADIPDSTPGMVINRAFVSQLGGTIQPLAVPPGIKHTKALGVSESGDVVGTGFNPGSLDDTSRALLWRGGDVLDLNTVIDPGSGWLLLQAFAINDQGQIVGQGKRGEELRGFLLQLKNTKVDLVFEPNRSQIQGLELFTVEADGFHEVTAAAALTNSRNEAIPDSDLVFVPDDAPTAIVCDQSGTRVWPGDVLSDGTPIPANFTRPTLADGRAKLRVRAGTRPGEWFLTAKTPESTGGTDFDLEALTMLGTPGSEVPASLLGELKLALLDPQGAVPSTAGDGLAGKAAIQHALLEWLGVLKYRQRPPLAEIEFAPIHTDGGDAAIVFYPRHQDAARLRAHFASNGVVGTTYPTAVLDIGLAQLISGGGNLPERLPTLDEWEFEGVSAHGPARAGRLVPHPAEAFQYFNFPYPLPLTEPATVLRRQLDDQCTVADPGAFGATVHSPVALLFTDTQGRRLGVDATGAELLEVPGGVINHNDAGEPAGYLLPIGDYTVVLTGTGKGKATITFQTPTGNGSGLSVFELKAKPGVTGSLTVGPTGPASTLVFGGKTFTATEFGATKSAHSCTAGKKKCVATMLAGLLGCQTKAAKSGAADPACLVKVRDKFDGGANEAKGCFAKLEKKGGCLTEGDTDEVAARVNDTADALAALVDPAFPTPTANACIGAKLKCTAARVKSVLGCHAKAEKTGALDPECIAGATAKFEACIAKAEKKGECLTNRDALAIGGTLDAKLDGLVCALDPVRQLVPCE